MLVKAARMSILRTLHASGSFAMSSPLRVTIWNEYRHERESAAVGKVYPEGIQAAIAGGLREMLPAEAVIRTATLDEPEHGLTEEVLAETDVLTWWAHKVHAAVSDEVVERVHKRVLEGMGLIALHSAHYSKVFKRLMGTGCGLKWRDVGELERVYVVDPGHAIADGLPGVFEIPREEMYSEFFDVPAPDELVMLSWFEGGNVFRSCCTWRRGKGRVVYFRPGHEMFPTFFQPEVRRVIANAVKWAAPRSSSPYSLESPYERPKSPIARVSEE
jgi:trehalose utilization protein